MTVGSAKIRNFWHVDVNSLHRKKYLTFLSSSVGMYVLNLEVVFISRFWIEENELLEKFTPMMEEPELCTLFSVSSIELRAGVRLKVRLIGRCRKLKKVITFIQQNQIQVPANLQIQGVNLVRYCCRLAGFGACSQQLW